MAASIISNTIIASAGRAINVALGIVALGLISRYLGLAQFGTYAALLAFGAVIQILADAGLYLTLTRGLAENKFSPDLLLGHIMGLRLALLLFFFSLSAALVFYFSSLNLPLAAYFWIALGLCCQSLSQLFIGIFQKHGVIWRATLGDIVGRLVQLGGLVLLGAARVSLTAAAALLTISSATALLFHRFTLPSRLKVYPKFNYVAWRAILITSAPLATLLIVNVIHFRLDLILLNLMRSAESAGLYGIAYRLIESLLFLPAMFSGLLLPRLTGAWQDHKLLVVSQYLNEGLKVLVAIAAYLTLSLLYLAPAIITLVSGSQYASAAFPLRLLALTLIPLFIGNLAGFTLIACHRQKTLLRIASLTLVINLSLNLIFIPLFGIPAAALTTLLTETIAAVAAMRAVSRLTTLAVSPAYFGRLSLALLAAAAVYQLFPSLLIALPLATTLFFSVSFLFGLFSRINLPLLLSAAKP